VLAGGGTSEVAAEFLKATAKNLNAAITENFTGKPRPKSADYLLDILANDGRPSLRGRVHLALGLVDSPKANDERLIETVEASDFTEWRKLWSTDEALIRKHVENQRTVTRLEAGMRAKMASDLVESEALVGGTASKRTTDALLDAKDALAAAIVRSRIEKTLGISHGVDTHALVRDLKAWNEGATAAEKARVRQPGSKFQAALKGLPKNRLFGINAADLAYLRKVAGWDVAPTPPTTGGSGTAPKAPTKEDRSAVDDVLASLVRLSTTSKIERNLRTSKFVPVVEQLRSLSPDGRALLMKQLGSTKDAALRALEAKLKLAGLNEGDIAAGLAIVGTRYGDVGGESGYERVVRLVNPPWWKKMPIKAEKVFKTVVRLRREELAQLLGDSATMTKVRALAAKEAIWLERVEAFLLASGTTKLDESGTAEDVIARSDRSLDPAHWAAQITEKSSLGAATKVFLRAQGEIGRHIASGSYTNEPLDFLVEIRKALKPEVETKLAAAMSAKPTAKLTRLFDEGKMLKTTLLVKKADKRTFSADRAVLVAAFEDTDDKVLLDEWSNLREMQMLTRGIAAFAKDEGTLVQQIKKLRQEQIDNRDPTLGPAEASKRLQNLEMQLHTKRNLDVDALRKEAAGFTFGMKASMRAKLMNAKRLKSDDLLQIEQRFTERLILAAKRDSRVQDALRDAGVTVDEWAEAKMRGVDALLIQRRLDKTRQWDAFSGASSHLDQATRDVKGSMVTGEQAIVKSTMDQTTTPEDLTNLRRERGKALNQDVRARADAEAAFRDMQARFEGRLELLISLILAAAITAATMGAGAAITTGVMIAMAAGQAVIKAAVRYFVLKKPIDEVATRLLLDVFGSTVGVLGAGIGVAAEQSFLHPEVLGKGAEFLSPALSKGISKTVKSIVLFAPKTVVKNFYDRKPLSAAIAKGKEVDVKKALVKKGIQTVGRIPVTFGLGIAKALKGEGQAMLDEARTGESRPEPQHGPQQTFGERYNSYLTTDDQSAKAAKMAKKDVKKQIMKDLGLNPKVIAGMKQSDRTLIDNKMRQHELWVEVERLERQEREEEERRVEAERLKLLSQSGAGGTPP
jgi:hypothetical protein